MKERDNAACLQSAVQNTKSVFLCHPAVLNYSYAYDKGGNITKKTIYPYTAGSLNGVAPTQTIVYNYGNSSWTDLLTSYNGQSIAYDAIGNPTSYLGYTLKWNGRQLSSLSGNGTTASYKYDADGLRSYKKVNGVETTYQYVGDKLMYEKRGTTEFYYYYNSFGNLAGIKYVQNGTEYMVYAVCNMRGDVEDLYWGSGNLACHYTYDTWGNVISVTDINGKEITNENNIGLMNPIRYRGYYYDSEIGMYYLQSRYYNPQVGRFISADSLFSQDSVFGNNLFAYCLNNPINMIDTTGQWPKWVSGAIDIVSGTAQIVCGIALGIATGWSGVGAVAGAVLIANGAGTFSQGVGKIVNSVAKKEVLREDNIVRTTVTHVGETIGGQPAAVVTETLYDAAVTTASLYALKVQIDNIMPKVVKSPLFSINNGRGFKLGKHIEMLYQNPNAAGGPGGTIFSYNGPLGKFRIDWDPAHGFHCHPPGH